MTFNHEIADSLAEPGFTVIPEFISAQEILQLREVIFQWKEEGDLKLAGIGQFHANHINQQVRGDLIKWVNTENPNPAVNNYLAKIDALKTFLNRSCFLGLKDYEMHYTAYPPGSFFARHSDRFQNIAHRVVSTVLYLNPGWSEVDGGQLLIYTPDGNQHIIPPVGGSLVIFRSELEHEVLPTTAHRYSITGWLLDQLADLTFLP